ncbi:MAG: glycosyltransferase family 4 protein [Anaerolineales bacterium]|nr:glycosyltransferase family 4 protein [Anaerolineales bacterium]
MNILFMTQMYPPVYSGGYEIVCQQVVDSLHGKGHQITVLTSSLDKETVGPEPNIYRLLHYFTPKPRGGIQKRLFQIAQIFLARQNYIIARNLIQEINPDLVFVWQMQFTTLQPVFAAQNLDCPLVFKFGSHWLIQFKEELEILSSLQVWLRKAQMGFRDFSDLKIQGAVYTSQHLIDQTREAGIFPLHNVLIPNSIPDEAVIPEINRLFDSIRPLKMVYIGRFSDAKGTPTAVKALSYLVNEKHLNSITLTLIGKGLPEFLPSLQLLIEEEKLTDHIQFREFIPWDQVLKALEEFDILLFPTPEFEGFGMAVIEAMAKGLIVVASDINGPNGIISSEIDGILVPPGDWQAMGEAVYNMLEHPESARLIQSTALEKVRTNYSQSSAMKMYEEFLRSLY